MGLKRGVRIPKHFVYFRSLGRYANVAYDLFALPKNLLPLAFIMKPNLLYHVNSTWAQTAGHWLNEGPKFLQASRILAGVYLSGTITLTFLRLGYFIVKKEAPPSVAEYPKVLYKATEKLAEMAISRVLSSFISLNNLKGVE